MYMLIGNPLGHSYSEPIHRAFGEYEYCLHPLPEEELDAFMRSNDWEGLNVTIPYKQKVIPYCTRLSEEAEKIGSVNTVVREGADIVGYNTDYLGAFAAAYRAGIIFGGKKVVILGSGGTSLTMRHLAADCKAREIVVVSRTGEDNYGNISRHADADILINTTPVGMYPHNGECPVSLDIFPKLDGVIDVIYNPLRTPLIAQAERRHIKCTGGLYMLVAQAAISCGLFCGKKKSKEEIGQVFLDTMRNSGNIVLVGMPGSGKTTVGAAISAMTGRELIDTDEMIAERAGMSIPEIFEKYGEAHFRALEHEAVVDAGKMSGKVISTGGGAVKDISNCEPLTQNGRVYFILRELSKLDRASRPLSAGADLVEMYRERRPMYMRFSDMSVENDSTPEECAKKILEDYNENIGDKRTKS